MPFLTPEADQAVWVAIAAAEAADEAAEALEQAEGQLALALHAALQYSDVGPSMLAERCALSRSRVHRLVAPHRPHTA